MSPVPKKSRFKKTDKPVSTSTSEIDPRSGVIRFELDKVSTLPTEGRKLSEDVTVGGVRWRACVFKRKHSQKGSNWMTLFLHGKHSDSDSSSDNKWKINVDAEYIFINADNRLNISVMGYKKEFQQKNHLHGFDLIRWSDLLNEKNGFIKDDKITVEVRFTIVQMKGFSTVPHIDFMDASDPRRDVTLLINGVKLYVGKQILAINSLVFDEMFYGNFDQMNKKEIELKEIDRKEFIQLLNVIYPPHEKITEINAQSLLKLANRFQIKTIIDQVELFLIDSNKMTVSSKIKLADQYQLVKLLEHCLKSLNTVKDIQNIKTTGAYGTLSDKTKFAVLEKVMDIE